MEYSTRDEGCEKKIKYVPPELISRDKDKGLKISRSGYLALMAAVLFLAAVLALMEMLNKVTGIFFIRFSAAIDDLSVPRALYVAAFRLLHPLATTSFLLIIITLSII